MKFNKIAILLLLISMLSVLSACGSTDLVAKVAVTSLDALVKAIPDEVALDDAKGGWAVNGLDGKERLILSKDFSSSNPDLAVEFDAAPFISAGLDASKLPADQYTYDEAAGKITMPYEYGPDKFGGSAEKSALEAFKQIVKTHRSIIGYHEQGDHYMVTLDKYNNIFAWAKDMSTNKIDLAFALDPKPLVDAGVDTGKLKEWVFAKLPITDEEGRQIKVDVFMKGFNIG